MTRSAWVALVAIAALCGVAPAAAAQDSAPPASPHGDLATPCADCHSATGWKPARISDRFDHGATGFGLEGGHATANCLSCHTSLDFRGTSPTCAGCHQDVHLGRLGAACADCHTPRGFTDRATMYRRHQLGRFPLDGPHAAVECAQCHRPAAQGALQYANLPTDCAQCHQAAFRETRNPDHVAAGFTATCTDCHSRNSWRGGHFDHGTTAYPLTGAHAAATCQASHADGVFKGRDQTCVACHVAAFDATTAPPHRQAQFPTDCTLCHTGPTTWAGASFDHDAGNFPLVGAHRAVACETCHAGGTWAGRPTTCAGCHQARYDATRAPDHRAAGFSLVCTDCHTQSGWPGATFDHGTTDFPLSGGHRAATCADCHGDGVYGGKPTTCISCHQAQYDGTTAPDHRASSLPIDCTQCHSTSGWSGAAFDHGVTRFPLTGGHRAAACLDCHGDGVYRGRDMSCVSCHQAQYDGTTAPDHRASSLPLDCTQCHSTSGWSGAAFDHGVTRFALTGSHQAVPCLDCHVGGVYRGLGIDCVNCHRPDYDGTTQPNHAAAAMPLDCTICHSTGTWGNLVFNHSSTRFPLTGAHIQAECASCHTNGTYQGTTTTCSGCHQADYDATRAPDHRASGLPTDCVQCHTTATWGGGSFNHATTAFPLTGAHLASTCQDCHGDGVYNGKPTTCVSCHQASYDATTSPPHRAAGFPTDCTSCHTTVQWPGAPFQHDATQFPLTGAHRAVTCMDCHADGVYDGKPTACFACHQPDYTATTEPPHQSLAFPTDCQLCHTTMAWPGGTYNHSTTSFPLTGAHTGTPCASCHVGGVYRGTPATCSSCHLADFNATVNPNHRTAMFPTDCLACHTTATWIGARFDHDARYFPIYTGDHRGKWASCATCHTNSQNYAVFTCLTCHEHSRTKMDDKHKGRAGYSYTSAACLSCHPRGDA